MRYRTIKMTPEGKQSREKVREVVRGVHVIPLEENHWQVRTFGGKPVEKIFRQKKDAMTFAKSMGQKKHSKIVLHRRRPRTASVLEPSTI